MFDFWIFHTRVNIHNYPYQAIVPSFPVQTKNMIFISDILHVLFSLWGKKILLALLSYTAPKKNPLFSSQKSSIPARVSEKFWPFPKTRGLDTSETLYTFQGSHENPRNSLRIHKIPTESRETPWSRLFQVSFRNPSGTYFRSVENLKLKIPSLAFRPDFTHLHDIKPVMRVFRTHAIPDSFNIRY